MIPIYGCSKCRHLAIADTITDTADAQRPEVGCHADIESPLSNCTVEGSPTTDPRQIRTFAWVGMCKRV